jgi:hypothetical protein
MLRLTDNSLLNPVQVISRRTEIMSQVFIICANYLLVKDNRSMHLGPTYLTQKDAMRMEEEKIDVKALRKVRISNQMSGMRDSVLLPDCISPGLRPQGGLWWLATGKSQFVRSAMKCHCISTGAKHTTSEKDDCMKLMKLLWSKDPS